MTTSSSPSGGNSCTGDDFMSRKKLVHSGQKRLYYKATCDECGWEAKGFRVSEERAREDFGDHLMCSRVREATSDAR